MDNRIRFLVLAVISLIVVLFLKRVRHAESVKLAAMNAVQKDEEPPAKAPAHATKVAAAAPAPPEPAGNLNGVDYNVSASGKTTLTVTVMPKAVCYAADYEAMALATGTDGVLLTLEPMDGPASAKMTRKLPVKSLYRGVQVELPVDVTKTKLFGLYLCGDSSGQGACRPKQVAAIEDVLKNPKNARSHRDETFFFQLMVLEPHDALAYSGNAKGIGHLAETLPKHDLSPKVVAPAVDDAARKMARLKSLPVVPKRIGGKLAMTIDMPFLGCGMAH